MAGFSIKPKTQNGGYQDRKQTPVMLILVLNVSLIYVKCNRELSDLIFGDLRDLVTPFVESCLKHDMSFIVGMMVQIENFIKQHEGTAYSFLLLHLEILLSKLTIIFDKFVVSWFSG